MQENLKKLTEGQELTSGEIEQCFDTILQGEASPALIAAFITALKMKGETPQDITAGANCLRRKAKSITAPQDAVDIVGTGGDGIGTWNISTATALVVAGAGISVAKHGNRAVSSKSGAADVLKALNVNLDAEPHIVEKAINEANIGFLMAPLYHSAMRHVGGVRAELGYRTIFNMLGPLSNPAKVNRIMVGIFAKKWLQPFAETLQNLGVSHGIVIHGRDGLDEVTTTTETDAILIRKEGLTPFTISPQDIDLPYAQISDLIGGNPDENAIAISELLQGKKNAYRDIVILNAAAALFGTGHSNSLQEGATRAISSINEGKALSCLNNLKKITNMRD